MLEMGRCGTPARYAGKDLQAGSVALKCHTSTTRGEKIVRRRISYPPRLRIRELSALHRDLFLSIEFSTLSTTVTSHFKRGCVTKKSRVVCRGKVVDKSDSGRRGGESGQHKASKFGHMLNPHKLYNILIHLSQHKILVYSSILSIIIIIGISFPSLHFTLTYLHLHTKKIHFSQFIKSPILSLQNIKPPKKRRKNQFTQQKQMPRRASKQHNRTVPQSTQQKKMPRRTAKQHNRTVPHRMDTELQHPFFRNIKSILDHASGSIVFPIVLCAVAIGLFLSIVIPFMVVVSMWIEEGLYTFFDGIAALCGGYLLGLVI